MHTEKYPDGKRNGGRSSNLSRVSGFHLFLNNKSIVLLQMEGKGVTILVIFCGRHKCMTYLILERVVHKPITFCQLNSGDKTLLVLAF